MFFLLHNDSGKFFLYIPKKIGSFGSAITDAWWHRGSPSPQTGSADSCGSSPHDEGWRPARAAVTRAAQAEKTKGSCWGVKVFDISFSFGFSLIVKEISN